MLKIFYDPRDEKPSEKIGDLRHYWLDDLGAIPFTEADPQDHGFLFAGARPMEDYIAMTRKYPYILERP